MTTIKITALRSSDNQQTRLLLPILGIPVIAPVALEILEDMAELQITPRPLVGRASPASPRSPEAEYKTPPAAPRKSKFFSTSPDSDLSASFSEDSPDKKQPLNRSSSDSSANTTPTKLSFHTPIKPLNIPQFETPTPIKGAKKVIQENDTTADLVLRDKKALERGLVCLDALRSPEHSKQVASVRGLVVDALNRESPVMRLPHQGSKKQRNLSFAIEKCDETAGWVRSSLKHTNTLLVNRDHHIKFENGSGKHICPLGDPLDDRIVHRRINLANGIWCGFITDPHHTQETGKFSTFIPRIMAETHYYSLIAHAVMNREQTIARIDNRGLFVIDAGRNLLFIEAYFRQEGNIIHSAFPVFHFEKYNGKEKFLKIEISYQFRLGEKPVSLPFERPYDFLFETVKKLSRDHPAVQYDTDAALIIDLGLLIGDHDKYGACPIPRGILISFPKKLF